MGRPRIDVTPCWQHEFSPGLRRTAGWYGALSHRSRWERRSPAHACTTRRIAAALPAVDERRPVPGGSAGGGAPVRRADPARPAPSAARGAARRARHRRRLVDARTARGARRGRGDPRQPLAGRRGRVGSASTASRSVADGTAGGGSVSGPRRGAALALLCAAAPSRRAGSGRTAHAHPRVRLRDLQPDAGQDPCRQPRLRDARREGGAGSAGRLPGAGTSATRHRSPVGRRPGELVPCLRGVAARRAVLRRR